MRLCQGYVVWKPGTTPPRTEHFTPLLPLWLSLKTGVDVACGLGGAGPFLRPAASGHDNESKLTEDAPCPAGEVFFMFLGMRHLGAGSCLKAYIKKPRPGHFQPHITLPLEMTRLLHFLMSQLQQLRKDGSIDMNDLAVLVAPSFCLGGWVVGGWVR